MNTITKLFSLFAILLSFIASACTVQADDGSGCPPTQTAKRSCPDGTYYDAKDDVCVQPAEVPPMPPPVTPKEIVEVTFRGESVWNTTLVCGGSVGTLTLRTSCDIEVQRVRVGFSGDTPSYKLKTPDGRSIFYEIRLMSLNEEDRFNTVAGPVELTGFGAYFDGTEYAAAYLPDSFLVRAGKKELAVQVMILKRDEYPEIAKSTWHYTTRLGEDLKGFERGDILVRCPSDLDWRILEEDEISYSWNMGSVTFDPFLR